jgi:hypothetical protein
MAMPNLRRWPSSRTLRRVIVVAFIATFGLFLLFQWHDAPLSPYTIVSFELAWTPEQATPMLTAWGAAGQQVARESLWLDFAFMPAYAFLFAGVVLVAARSTARRMPSTLQNLGLWLVVAPFVAWASDITENLALLRVLAAPADPSRVALQVAGLASSFKFELLLLCLGYTMVAFILRRR